MRSEQLGPPCRQFVFVGFHVAGEGAADDHGDAGAEGVAFAADAGDGDGFGAQFAVDAHVHLRRLRLVRHGFNVRPCRWRMATARLPWDTLVCRLARSHNAGLTSTDSRSHRQVDAGVRGTPSGEEVSALPIVTALEACPDASCRNAVSHESLCECLHCLGAGHGIVHRPARELAAAAVTARIARTGDVFLGAANDDDCEAF